MSEILLAPVAEKPGIHVGGRLWRKQVLKHGSLNYKGRTLNFNEDYSRELANAFYENAFDTVPFVLADEKNGHTMAPERARGEILDFIPTPEGLDAIVRLSEDAAKIVEDNPKFGVSVRIVENLKRGDGYATTAAIQHVLGTFDPRITGMSPWEVVEMSNDADDKVIDLTKGEGEMPFSEEQEARLRVLLDMPEEKFAALVGADTDDDLTPEEMEALEAFLNEVNEEEEEPVAATLSNESDDDSPEAVELSALREEQAATRRELAQLKWEKERDALLSQGIPPAMIDLAAPALTGEPAMIDLSNGETTDARGIIRRILNEAAGYVDLSEERGHQGAAQPDANEEMHKAADAAGWE